MESGSLPMSMPRRNCPIIGLRKMAEVKSKMMLQRPFFRALLLRLLLGVLDTPST